ncbi:MAG: sugar MFS transporter [Acidobacteria bacterium]|nr:sugar MFS transporter [Acidobacteriota bacterium]MBV9479237.1 sugar MFS transporter [Acidobacteriota bacterium]
MSVANTKTSAEHVRSAPGKSYGGALAIVTTLFFMWGSLTSLNDVLIPYAQHVFSLRLAASMLIQTAFFSAYFVFSIPSARIIDWIGYKKAIVVGLLTMVAACLAFYPAAKIPSFPFFLFALIVLATGITVLQVAANPYVAVLGKPQTASSRLNLTQAFNSLGTAVFPWIGAHVILGTTTSAVAQSTSSNADAIVKLYVYFFALALFLLAMGIGASRLPKIESAEHQLGEKVNDSLWKHPNLIFGAIGIFVYVGAEVAIGSSIANYLALPNIGGFASDVADPTTRYHQALSIAARYISLYWLGAMIGRFLGSAALQKIKPGLLLAIFSTVAASLVTISVLTAGHFALWTILSVGLFNSIMFPCIFTMGIAELGPLTGDGSGILNTAIVGGAVIPYLVGKVGDFMNRTYYPAMTQGETSWGQGIHYALILPVLCYLYILFFAVSGSKTNSERYGAAS